MEINTTRFGIIEIDPDRVIQFYDGIPGLEDLTRFILVIPEEKTPMRWLQSVEDASIAFVVADPFAFKPDYSPDIPDEVLHQLGTNSIEDLALFVIMVIPKEVHKMTANLMAPLIINTCTLKGKQVILDHAEYPIRYRIFHNEEKGEAVHAGTLKKKK